MPERSHVELSLPADPSLLRLARENACLIAEAAGFGREEAEDLRLAVDELCVLCSADHGPNARIRLRFLWDKSAVAVRCVVDPAGSGAPDDGTGLPAGLRPAEISARLLGELVDSYTIEFSGPNHKRGWLVKRHRPELDATRRTAAGDGRERTADIGGSKDG
jgi:hypothetical protein